MLAGCSVHFLFSRTFNLKTAELIVCRGFVQLHEKNVPILSVSVCEIGLYSAFGTIYGANRSTRFSFSFNFTDRKTNHLCDQSLHDSIYGYVTVIFQMFSEPFEVSLFSALGRIPLWRHLQSLPSPAVDLIAWTSMWFFIWNAKACCYCCCCRCCCCSGVI